MPAKPKPKIRPPKHQFVRPPAVRMATVLRIIGREAIEHRSALDDAEAMKARYEQAKA